MTMNFNELNGTTREWMLRRFEAEESSGNPYRSEALSEAGLASTWSGWHPGWSTCSTTSRLTTPD